jgi:hypothetical protein
MSSSILGYAPVSYGQNFADWQQYAGFGKENPFGVDPNIMAQQPAKQAPAVPPLDTTMPTPDYSLKPVAPVVGMMGTQTANTMGNPSLDPYKKALNSHFGE